MFWKATTIIPLSIALRLILLLWGHYQDTHSPLKYTDIDYLVFTDASRYLAHGQSPYERDTYRYTPLLAWLLYPTVWGGLWTQFGKVVFALGDVVTGWLIYCILVRRFADVDGGSSTQKAESRAVRYASIWWLNPMVANISTRGSSEGLLAVIVVALLWAVLRGRTVLAGLLLGLGVHFKIYPFVYAASIWWWMGGDEAKGNILLRVFSRQRITLAVVAFASFMALNVGMFHLYGMPFVEHSYTYHLTRLDHRHNFSVHNILLHLRSATGPSSGIKVESLAFLPQLSLSVILLPLALAKKDLSSTMLVQTFTFVTFNKVCTSQYFLWYMVFLPFYLPQSMFLKNPRLGAIALILWVVGQAVWLQQGYQLEFLGKSVFVPGLWLATILFFGINCWILGLMVYDIRNRPSNVLSADAKERKVK